MSKFIAVSRQATGLDKTRVLLETRIQEVKDEAKKWAEVATKAKDDAKGLKTLVEELKAEATKKDLRLEELKRNMTSRALFFLRQKRMQWPSLKCPNNTLTSWTPTMQRALKISGWTLQRSSLMWTSAPLYSI